jgi:hypothetical protein
VGVGEAFGATVTRIKGNAACAGAAGAQAPSAIMEIKLRASAMQVFVFIKSF